MPAQGPLLDKIRERVARDKEEGDIAYFHALGLQLEYFTKLITAGVLACLGEDADRHRYSLEYRLVRANSLGDWVETLNVALTGPAAQFFVPAAQPAVRELTERVGSGDARYEALESIQEAASALGIKAELGAKAPLRQLFDLSSAIRNRRGHGATTGLQCSRICPLLVNAVRHLEELQLLSLSWVHLHRNLSGKYRVLPLLGDCTPFEHFKKTRDEKLPNGTYLYLQRPVAAKLVFANPDTVDIFLPNGNFKGKSFETLSYVTNECRPHDGSGWIDPPGRLPPSETDGRPMLEPVGNTFANLPPQISSYIPRPRLERMVLDELLTSDRHPAVSLTGPGGIGKTSLAISVLHSLARLANVPYEVILWMSARDIDLLESGPKPVLPRVTSPKEIARVAVELLEPAERSQPDFDAQGFFARCLSEGAVGPTLFVFDNFETLESPADAFKWIDTYIRPPNKALITTRFRDFVGDYPIEVRGMSEEEASALIDRESERLGVRHLIGGSYKEELITESEGHPYVIKMLLGEVAKQNRAGKPERIVAGADHVLTALFERTYANLLPASQRVFLLLCSWRVFVPALAVEAISLRPGNERFDVARAIGELSRFSLVEEVVSSADGMSFIGVPLPASMFGRRKLEASPFRAAIEEDRKLLIEFGAGKREDVERGVYPRVERLAKAIAAKASANSATLESNLPVLEYLARHVPRTYLTLAELVLEANDGTSSVERAQGYLRSFLESASPTDKQDVWLKLADLCRGNKDSFGEVHALSEMALLPTVSVQEISEIANRLNSRIHDLKGRKMEEAWSPEVRVLLERVATALERHMNELTATDCSRLAWLLLNVGQEDRANRAARAGLQRDPSHEHCQNLVNRLKIGHPELVV